MNPAGVSDGVMPPLTVPELMEWYTEWFGITFEVRAMSDRWYSCHIRWPNGRTANWFGNAAEAADPENWLRFLDPEPIQ